MSTTVGTIQYDVKLNLNQLKGDVKQAEKIVHDSNTNIESSSSDTGNKVSAMFGTIKSAAFVAGTAAVAAFGSFSYFGLKTAGDLQATEKGFITLLGSAEEASRVMARIKQEAKRTPFEMAGLASATQLLSSVTNNGDKAIDFLLDVGESLAAMGKGQAELDRIIVNLQQIGAVGKASMLDIKQFAFAGIPIFDMLQDTTGKTGEALEDMISNGEVTFEMLETMFKQATDEGGRFAGAFANQAGSFNQSVSNMKDTFMIFASDFVKQTGIFDGAVSVITGFTDLLTNNQEAIYSTVESVKEFTRKAIEVGRAVGEYLSPKLSALWATVQADLIPALKDLWKNVLEPLMPVIGVTLVVALVLLIETFTQLVKVVSTLISWGSKLIGWIGDAITAYVGFSVALSSYVITPLQYVIDKIAAVISWMWNINVTAVNVMKDMYGIIVRPFASAFEWIGNKIAWLLDKMGLLNQSAQNSIDKATSATRAHNAAVAGGAVSFGSGFATGGYTGRGAINEPAGIVHKGEYVIPQKYVDQSTGMPKQMAPSNSINITLNMDGIMARSRSDLRDIAKDMVSAINEELRAKGKMELAV